VGREKLGAGFGERRDTGDAVRRDLMDTGDIGGSTEGESGIWLVGIS
jgi:hypothetical protein